MNALDLFSGIGGFSLGLERAGMRTVAFCEIEPFCRQILAKHWPSVPCFPDITELRGADVGSVDVICGGFPCQDISVAGKGAGLAGKRSGLWSEYARIIDELRPRFVIVENVAALLNRGLERVLGDLAALGYDAEWHCIPASAIGAPHRRDRIWIIAYPIGSRRERLVTSADFSELGPWRWRGEEDLRAISGSPFERSDRWPQPILRRMDDGIPGKLDRLHCIGNAVVPQIPEIIGRAIMRAAE